MYEELMKNKLAIIATEYDEAETIRDRLKELDLFMRLSFDMERGWYVIYLKPVNMDNCDGLISLVNTNRCRLVKYY